MRKDKLRKYEAYKELEKIVKEMKKTIEAVVVEGVNDKKTLNLIGYNAPIFMCSYFLHIDLADLIGNKFSNVVILTDFDHEGKLLNKKLTKLFEERRVKTNIFFRRKFEQILKEIKILTIETIGNFKT
jgi:5S rRNA maturation endonuclease (ribonuclease M5)